MGTEEHTYCQEKQQGRYTVFISDLIGKNTDEKQQRKN